MEYSRVQKDLWFLLVVLVVLGGVITGLKIYDQKTGGVGTFATKIYDRFLNK